MIVSRGRTATGAPVVTVGFNRADLDRLGAGHPMAVDLRGLGLEETHIVLVGGDSENAVLEALVVAGLLPASSLAAEDSSINREVTTE